MSPAPTLEASLERLSEIRHATLGDAERADLRDLIAGPHSAAVAVAAEIAADEGLEEFIPDLVSAFHRMMESPVKRDPGCRGKASLAEALHRLDAREGELYRAGIMHRQMEPVWGGQKDTAGSLRSACGRGLVGMDAPDALLLLAESLADPELDVRLAAAQSIAYQGSSHALPLLRLKALAGDVHNGVVAECLLSMLRVEPAESLAFVERFLGSEDSDLAECAALALGESRAEGALAVLGAWREDAEGRGLSGAALTAIAMLRSDAAIDYLLGMVVKEPGPVAREAIAALGIHHHDDGLRERTLVAARRDDLDLSESVETAFGDGGG